MAFLIRGFLNPSLLKITLLIFWLISPLIVLIFKYILSCVFLMNHGAPVILLVALFCILSNLSMYMFAGWSHILAPSVLLLPRICSSWSLGAVCFFFLFLMTALIWFILDYSFHSILLPSSFSYRQVPPWAIFIRSSSYRYGLSFLRVDFDLLFFGPLMCSFLAVDSSVPCLLPSMLLSLLCHLLIYVCGCVLNLLVSRW